MATGWPMKTTYANGDVYAASDVNDITGTINLLTSTTLSQASGKNYIINGGFDIWQRGTSFASLSGNTLYTADRWLFKRLDGTTGGTVSRQASTQTGFQYAMRVQRNSGNTGTGGLYVYNTIETINSIPLAGKTITLSFYALKGANFSASNLEVYVGYGTGTDQQMGSTGFTGQATVLNTTQVLTTTATRYTFTGTVPSTATEVGMYLGFSPTGTAGAADYFDVSGVQIEIGSTATTFSRAGGTIQNELAACQRYFERYSADAAANGAAPFAMGIASSTTVVNAMLRPYTTKRVVPTITFSSNTDFRLYDFVNIYSTTAMSAPSSCSIDVQGQGIVIITATVASGLTQFRSYYIIPIGPSGNRFIDISAEL